MPNLAEFGRQTHGDHSNILWGKTPDTIGAARSNLSRGRCGGVVFELRMCLEVRTRNGGGKTETVNSGGQLFQSTPDCRGQLSHLDKNWCCRHAATRRGPMLRSRSLWGLRGGQNDKEAPTTTRSGGQLWRSTPLITSVLPPVVWANGLPDSTDRVGQHSNADVIWKPPGRDPPTDTDSSMC